ncbi:MAG TPA: Ig-like domain-containing protein [Marmoricola sp.]|jgi:hypothetical protein|nr:Ig-like domain-containing protein [Marmoricola sp.]
MHPRLPRPVHRRRVNGKRRSFLAVFALAVSGLSVGLLNPFAAHADPQGFGLSMVSGSGSFVIAGNQPGAPLGDPTSVTGNFDAASGDFTDVSFASPSIHVVQQVTQPLPVTVTIDEQLIPLAPGTGHIDANGDMSLSLSFKLHVNITASVAHGDCYSQPVNVNLTSTSPYDPTTGLVTLKAAGFNIPNLETTDDCGTIITNNAGAQFAGTNNSLQLTLHGDLSASLADSATALAVSPPSPVTAGTSTVMSATVTPADASGQVDFYDGQTLLGSGSTDGNGVATLTDKLDAGSHQLSAKYVGNASYAASTSASAPYLVQGLPNFGADFPAVLTPGAAPSEFAMTVNNPSSGVAANLRVDFNITQTPTDTSAGGLNVTPSQLSMEYQDGNGDWQPMGLVQGVQTYSAMTASYGTLTGFNVNPGQTRTVHLRMATAVGTVKRTLNATASLLAVDPTTGAQVKSIASIASSIAVPPATRVDASALNVVVVANGNSAYRGELVALQGNVVAATNVAGQAVNPVPAGQAELLVDGVPTSTVDFASNVAAAGATIPMVPLTTPASSGGFTREFIDTSGLSVGNHTVQLHYFGDTNYKAGFSAAMPFTVLPAYGQVYDCTYTQATGGIQYHWRTLVSGIATLPGAVASGSTINIGDASVQIGMPVVTGTNQGFAAPLRGLVAQLSPNGSLNQLTPNAVLVNANTTTQFDNRATWSGLTAAVTVQGQPGDVVDVGLPVLSFTNTSLRFGVTCQARSTAASLGKVTIAGTTLTVTPSGTASLGQNLTLTAQVTPATSGSVEFFDGDTSLGVVPVAAGKAVLNTANLGGGTHELTAHYSGGSITVNGVSLSVAPNDSNVVETLVQYSTKTTLTSSSGSVASGPVTLTAKVATDPASAAVPVGSVQFKADGAPLGSPVTLVNGQGQLTTSAIPAGAHAITAAYSGGDSFAASASSGTTVSVGKVVTSIVVAAANGAPSGLSWKAPAMSATLTSPAGPTAGKTITFKIGSTTACSAVTNAAGVATCAGSVPSLVVLLQTHYTGSFAGDATATAATGTGALGYAKP